MDRGTEGTSNDFPLLCRQEVSVEAVSPGWEIDRRFQAGDLHQIAWLITCERALISHTESTDPVKDGHSKKSRWSDNLHPEREETRNPTDTDQGKHHESTHQPHHPSARTSPTRPKRGLNPEGPRGSYGTHQSTRHRAKRPTSPTRFDIQGTISGANSTHLACVPAFHVRDVRSGLGSEPGASQHQERGKFQGRGIGQDPRDKQRCTRRRCPHGLRRHESQDRLQRCREMRASSHRQGEAKRQRTARARPAHKPSVTKGERSMPTRKACCRDGGSNQPANQEKCVRTSPRTAEWWTVRISTQTAPRLGLNGEHETTGVRPAPWPCNHWESYHRPA